MTTEKREGYVFFLAVLPVYREACIRTLLERHGDEIQLYAGDAQLDATVRTGISEGYFRPVRNIPLLGNRLLLQCGGLRSALRSDVCVIDLNPRSLSAWVIALMRKAGGRRTLAWGHLHPRSGASSRTAPLRRLLRKITAGTILYGYDSVAFARRELPGKPVWVAPNSLYSESDILASQSHDRRRIVYVGRLEAAKNVQILVEGFARSKLRYEGYTLDIVGFGSLEADLRRQAEDLEVTDFVNIHGRIDCVDELAKIYSDAAFSVSPGYVGLSVTQSLGFGVPMLYAETATHSPEIELARFGAMKAFAPNTATGLGDAMALYAREIRENLIDRHELAARVRAFYSAEAMAAGLWSALCDVEIPLAEDGWPIEEHA
ncbi:glycosyltransferase [Rhodococcus hoagii]|nr:glycosyltransferase [Prescottella equi]